MHNFNGGNMKKFIEKMIVFIVLLFIILKGINFIMFDDIHSYTRLMFEEMYEYNGNIDIVFLGSSHVYRSYDTKVTDEIFKENTFNAGSSSQLLDGSYYVLKEIIKNKNLDEKFTDYKTITRNTNNEFGTLEAMIRDTNHLLPPKPISNDF